LFIHYYKDTKQLIKIESYLGLFKITNAAITPGTQPQKVSNNTIKKEPHPFPITESGGKTMANNTRKKLIQF